MPPIKYGDGVVALRRLDVTDIERDLEAKDHDQIDWMWNPGERELWEAMTSDEQRAHAMRHLARAHDSFGGGPKWAFAVDTESERYVAYVDCDLANDHVPLGQANIAFSAHPQFRGRGYVSRAVRLVLLFLKDNTDATEAHINVDARNESSLRVARAVEGRESESWENEFGFRMVRFVVPLR